MQEFLCFSFSHMCLFLFITQTHTYTRTWRGCDLIWIVRLIQKKKTHKYIYMLLDALWQMIFNVKNFLYQIIFLPVTCIYGRKKRMFDSFIHLSQFYKSFLTIFCLFFMTLKFCIIFLSNKFVRMTLIPRIKGNVHAWDMFLKFYITLGFMIIIMRNGQFYCSFCKSINEKCV